MKKVFGMGLLVLVVLGCVFSPASAQDKWEAQVRNQLRAQADLVGDIIEFDLEEAFKPFIRSMKRNQYQDITYQLVAGTHYLFTGACDEDCRDLDFTLYSGSTKILEDIAADDKPEIDYKPTRTGTYTLRVTMVNCIKEPCRYGVGAYK
jgi:hypothetical protein